LPIGKAKGTRGVKTIIERALWVDARPPNIHFSGIKKVDFALKVSITFQPWLRQIRANPIPSRFWRLRLITYTSLPFSLRPGAGTIKVRPSKDPNWSVERCGRKDEYSTVFLISTMIYRMDSLFPDCFKIISIAFNISSDLREYANKEG
jgi:hypothetical protein